jgi:predicted small lipoprotein YifL
MNARIASTLVIVSLLSLAACRKAGPEVSSEAQGADVFRVIMPSQEAQKKPAHGEENWFAYGAVTGSEPGIAISGVANAQYFQDGTFAVNARINSPVPAKGTHYDGWITDGTTTVRMGTFSSPTGDVRMGLMFEGKKDYRAYTTFLVTLETDTDVNTVGKVVGEGTVKRYER